MTVREASVCKEVCHCVSYVGVEVEFCCEALQLRETVDFAISSFKRSPGAPFSLPVSLGGVL